MSGYLTNKEEMCLKKSAVSLETQDGLRKDSNWRSQYLEGPDQVIPSDNLVTTERDGVVKLRRVSVEKLDYKPISVPGMLKTTASKYPDNIAYVYKDSNGKTVKTTYKLVTNAYYEEYTQIYRDSVRICAKAFLKIGLERHHSVAILGCNSKEWFISYLAAIHAGGFAAGIYATNSAEVVCHCLENSNANIVVIDDEKQLEKINQVKNRLPQLKAIIQYSGTSVSPGVYSWEDIMKIGAEESETALDCVLKTLAINECCAITFTSGTEGYPKAVMLSHDNVLWGARALIEYISLKENSGDILVSYLPLSHVLAQIIDIFAATLLACCIYFADKDALKGTLLKTLQEARPTIFVSVPRVWEKMYERIVQVGGQSGIIKKWIANWARSCVLQHNTNKISGLGGYSLSYALASRLISATVKKAMGLDRCHLFVSGAAPISTELRNFFMSLDIIIMEGYGMSENAGTNSVCTPSAFNLKSVGKIVPGVQIKILNPDENGEGEICSYGRNIFMGYLNDPEKTSQALDEDGWLHSGDLGKTDEDNFLYITGRSKEIIITAGGENVPPVYIENLLKAELPAVSNVMLVGDKKKFLSVLLTMKTVLDNETGQPTDELTNEVKQWCESLDCRANTVTELLRGPCDKVLAAIQEGIDKANGKAISNAQKVQKFAILPQDFSVHTGELGPTLKMKRYVIAEKYAGIIEDIYA